MTSSSGSAIAPGSDSGATGAGAPLLLAVESATGTPSVALLRGSQPLAEGEAEAQRPPSESLLPAIERLLAHSGVAWDDLEAFAVSIGPGSFTGLRVGLATVKGLALEPPRPVVPVPTLAALAAAGGARPEPAVPLLDAQRGEVYAAVYEVAEDAVAERLAPGLWTPEALLARLPLPCTLLGEGVAVVAPRLAARAPAAGLRLLAPDAVRLRAGAVGRIAARLLASGQALPAADVVPCYVRRAEAEVRRLGAAVEASQSRRVL